MNNLHYFKGSLLVTFFGLAAAFALGGPSALLVALILSVLEVSLSFDNAVANATVLKNMNDVWKKRFLTWGMLIAVFGMRIVFPVLVVAIIAGINPIAALTLAVSDPKAYAHHLESSNVSLMAFGGAFLLLVGAKFFFDEEKDHHWFEPVEKALAATPMIGLIPYLVTTAIIAGMSFLQKTQQDQIDFAVSGAVGIAVFLALKAFSGWMEKKEEDRQAKAALTGNAAAAGGLGLFVYLEVLDASFSFDGVIGAFAITSNIFIIAIGLGIGAMFVRSMTIVLVEKDTLSEYKYLEHGAFYAICALALIMLMKSFTHIPEVITGLIGAAFIGVAFVHSLIENKSEEKNKSENELAQQSE